MNLMRKATEQERTELAAWFKQAFDRTAENDPKYFEDMVERYEKGTLWCYSDSHRRNTFATMVICGAFTALEFAHLEQFDKGALVGQRIKHHCLALRSLALENMHATMVLEELAALSQAIKDGLAQAKNDVQEGQAKVEQILVHPQLQSLTGMGLRYWLERILVYGQEDMENTAFVALQVEQQFGIAHRDQRGYTPANIDYMRTEGQSIEDVAALLNTLVFNHSAKEAMVITMSTMRA